jgi:hypothetical protein
MPRRGLGYGFGPYAPEPYDDRGADRISDLMLRGGDIAARRGETSGQIWGNTLANLGQIAGGAITQIGEQKAEREGVEAEAAKNQEFTQFLGQWDGDPAKLAETSVSLYGPEQGYKIAEATMRFSMLGQEDPQEAVKDWAMGIKLMDSLDEEKKATFYPGMIAASAPLAEKFKIDPAMLPQEYSPEAWDFVKKTAAVLMGDAPPELLKGDSFFDPETGEWHVAPKPEEPPKLSTLEGFLSASPEEQQRILAARGQIAAAERAPQAAPQAPQASLTDVDKIAQRWKTATAPTRDLTSQVQRMEAGIDAARRGDLAAGSQAVLVTFQKILDPTSVVRESEYERSSQNMGLAQRYHGQLEKALEGGAGVPLPELEKFARLAKEIVRKGSSAYLDAEKKRLGKLAREFDIDPALIFEDVDYTDDAANPFRSAPGKNPFR